MTDDPTDTDWAETCRAVVFPWHCDHIGHMNVRWYAHFFDDAGFHLWSMKGLSGAQLEELNVGLVVARTDTNFIRELTAGSMLVVRSAYTGIGSKSIRHTQRMFNADTGTLCAEQHTVEVMFDPRTRKSTAMPDEVRDTIAPHIVDIG